MSYSNRAKGYIFGAIAAITYGMNPLFALPVYADGMDAGSVLFFRYVLSLPILAVMIVLRGESFRLPRRAFLSVGLLGLTMAFSSLTLFESYNHMAAGIASTLLFVYPIMVAVIMAAFFRERIKLPVVLSIAMACGGIGLLYRDDTGATLSTVGVVLVVVSAIAYAIYLVWINHSEAKSVPVLTLTFYCLLSGLTIFIVRTDFATSIILPVEWYHWGNLLALALLPTVVSLVSTTRAIQYVGSTPTAILGALEPLTAVFFGVTVFGEPLTARIIGGIALVLLAVVVIISGGKKSALKD
ncbi:MAG: DMT family transporter [Candidatus Kapabacteria bacterium]|nr:DMT family transporter [Candidatus Kapabacteria bacterium]